ncbi:hypothetical protein HMPREF1981_01395 [Bacteroides pyogenes F0041]|uniref:Uncharacterized protein n=1 Tax=Bacteroides pyogenes F0041 TaxID=1321819 RepID=U2E0P7_9BACE|nr:hypothetical protein HMPREF1981_01395 [Bacteroides pyogenes F0041]
MYIPKDGLKKKPGKESRINTLNKHLSDRSFPDFVNKSAKNIYLCIAN